MGDYGEQNQRGDNEMKKSEFILTVTGEETTGMSICVVEFDGTPAQLMDAASSVLAAAKDAFIKNFDGEEDALSVFKESVVEFMGNGFMEDKKAFRNIALAKMETAHYRRHEEDIKKELDELVKELKKVSDLID